MSRITFGQPDPRLLPSVNSTSPVFPAVPLSTPSPQSFKDFRFQSIGRRPQLLDRFSNAQEGTEYQPSPSPEPNPKPGYLRTETKPKQRLTLLQALANSEDLDAADMESYIVASAPWNPIFPAREDPNPHPSTPIARALPGIIDLTTQCSIEAELPSERSPAAKQFSLTGSSSDSRRLITTNVQVGTDSESQTSRSTSRRLGSDSRLDCLPDPETADRTPSKNATDGSGQAGTSFASLRALQHRLLSSFERLVPPSGSPRSLSSPVYNPIALEKGDQLSTQSPSPPLSHIHPPSRWLTDADEWQSTFKSSQNLLTSSKSALLSAHRSLASSKAALTSAEESLVAAKRAVGTANESFSEAELAVREAEYAILKAEGAFDDVQVDFKLMMLRKKEQEDRQATEREQEEQERRRKTIERERERELRRIREQEENERRTEEERTTKIKNDVVMHSLRKDLEMLGTWIEERGREIGFGQESVVASDQQHPCLSEKDEEATLKARNQDQAEDEEDAREANALVTPADENEMEMSMDISLEIEEDQNTDIQEDVTSTRPTTPMAQEFRCRTPLGAIEKIGNDWEVDGGIFRLDKPTNPEAHRTEKEVGISPQNLDGTRSPADGENEEGNMYETTEHAGRISAEREGMGQVYLADVSSVSSHASASSSSPPPLRRSPGKLVGNALASRTSPTATKRKRDAFDDGSSSYHQSSIPQSASPPLYEPIARKTAVGSSSREAGIQRAVPTATLARATALGLSIPKTPLNAPQRNSSTGAGRILSNIRQSQSQARLLESDWCQATLPVESESHRRISVFRKSGDPGNLPVVLTRFEETDNEELIATQVMNSRFMMDAKGFEWRPWVLQVNATEAADDGRRSQVFEISPSGGPSTSPDSLASAMLETSLETPADPRMTDKTSPKLPRRSKLPNFTKIRAQEAEMTIASDVIPQSLAKRLSIYGADPLPIPSTSHQAMQDGIRLTTSPTRVRPIAGSNSDGTNPVIEAFTAAFAANVKDWSAPEPINNGSTATHGSPEFTSAAPSLPSGRDDGLQDSANRGDDAQPVHLNHYSAPEPRHDGRHPGCNHYSPPRPAPYDHHSPVHPRHGTMDSYIPPSPTETLSPPKNPRNTSVPLGRPYRPNREAGVYHPPSPPPGRKRSREYRYNVSPPPQRSRADRSVENQLRVDCSRSRSPPESFTRPAPNLTSRLQSNANVFRIGRGESYRPSFNAQERDRSPPQYRVHSPPHSQQYPTPQQLYRGSFSRYDRARSPPIQPPHLESGWQSTQHAQSESDDPSLLARMSDPFRGRGRAPRNRHPSRGRGASRGSLPFRRRSPSLEARFS